MTRFAQLLLLLALLGGVWWVGGRTPQAQIFVLALSAVSLLGAAISATTSGRGISPLTRAATIIVVIMLAFLVMQAIQVANPAFTVHLDAAGWQLVPLPFQTFLPAGFNAPFDGLANRNLAFTNPLRHLLVFGAAFCATVAAFIVSGNTDVRRSFVWAFVVQAIFVSTVSIAHRLSGAREILWFYTDPEFWMGSPIFPYKNTAAAYQVLLLGNCMAAFRSARDRSEIRTGLLGLSGLAAGLTLLALLLLNCRAGVIMGFILAALFIYQEWIARRHHRPSSSRRWLVAVAIACMLAGAGWVLVRGGFARTLQRFDSEFRNPISLLRGGMPRVQKQKIAVEMAKDRPWLGWGGGAYLPLFLTYHPKNPDYLRDLLREQPTLNRIQETSADGDWWEFPVEYGIVGVALLATSILGSGVLWLRMKGHRCIPSFYLFASAMLIVLHGFIDRILRDEILLATLGVTFALALRTAQSHAASSDRKPR